jgi:uncharacterized delta-60 repeat protein
VEIAQGRASRGFALLLASCALAWGGVAGQALAAKGRPGESRAGKRHPANRAGKLDRGFNGDGKLVAQLPFNYAGTTYPDYRLPFEFASGRIAMAQAGDGRLIVASNRALVEYLANGRPNPHFGGNGAVPVGRIEGFRFQLADIAVDSQGRVVTAGTNKPDPELGMTGPSVVGPAPTVATIRRYLPNGRLDPSFGSEGVVNTDLGAAPPSFKGQAYRSAAVGLVGVTVDAQDRPIVTGSAVTEVETCPTNERVERSQAIVARLTTNGALDGSFAGGGIKAIGGLSWLGLPQSTAGGVVSAGIRIDPCPRGGTPEPSTVLTGLAGDGSLDQAFSSGGFWSRPFTRISDLVVAPSGKLVLLSRTIELRRGRWVESAGEAIRLQRNGSFDKSFGRGGRAEIDLPRHSKIAAVAADREGRVLLAGTLAQRLRHRKRSQLRFLLIRTTPGGESDDHFGRNGRVTTAFGRGNVLAGEVLVDRAGRIAVVGKFSGPSKDGPGIGFALARYLGGG